MPNQTFSGQEHMVFIEQERIHWFGRMMGDSLLQARIIAKRIEVSDPG